MNQKVLASYNDRNLSNLAKKIQKWPFKPGFETNIPTYTYNADQAINQIQAQHHTGTAKHPSHDLEQAIWTANQAYYMLSEDFRQRPLQMTYTRLTSHDPSMHGVYTPAVAKQAIKHIFKYLVQSAQFHYKWFPGDGDYYDPQTALSAGHSQQVENYYRKKEKTIESKPNSYINKLKKQYKKAFHQAISEENELNVGTKQHPDNSDKRALAVLNANLLFISRRNNSTIPILPNDNTIEQAFQFSDFTDSAKQYAKSKISNQLITVYQYNRKYENNVSKYDITDEQF